MKRRVVLTTASDSVLGGLGNQFNGKLGELEHVTCDSEARYWIDHDEAGVRECGNALSRPYRGSLLKRLDHCGAPFSGSV